MPAIRFRKKYKWPLSSGRPAYALMAAALIGAALLAAPGTASAHGRLGAAQGRCRLYIGPDVMNFTGYLPEASKNEFCEDIPSTGPVIMVLDAEQDELRDMRVEMRIVKDVGGESKEPENLDEITVAYSAPKKYPSGTINFEHDFKEGGFFVGVVTVTGDHGERWTSRFPFSVDRSLFRDLPAYALMALGVLAASTIYLVHRRRQQPILAGASASPSRGSGPSDGDRQDHGPDKRDPDPEHEATPAE
jgi:hypothetical protein